MSLKETLRLIELLKVENLRDLCHRLSWGEKIEIEGVTYTLLSRAVDGFGNKISHDSDIDDEKAEITGTILERCFNENVFPDIYKN